MATQTTYLSLALLGIGENPGTWGVPINDNFSKIDILAGEIIGARGTSANVGDRISEVQTEVVNARGTKLTLDERLSSLLANDGTVNITNFPKASTTDLGVVALSSAPVDPTNPVVVETNDSRMLTQVEHDGLVLGGNTTLHMHEASSISDLTASATEINRSLTNTGSTVTAANLTALTNGSSVGHAIHTHPDAALGYKGFVSLSVTPALATDPVVVGDNDPRLLSAQERIDLTNGASTNLHGHTLADGATDLTVDATTLNRLTGAGATVTATNLNQITNGNSTNLHNHDGRYYTESEVDTQFASHDGSDAAHSGANLTLGNVNVQSMISNAVGSVVDVQADAGELTTANKIQVKDASSVVRFSVDASGSIECNDLVVNGTQTVVETTTLNQEAIATQSLTVNGDTTLGDDNTIDVVTVNAVTSTFNGDVAVNGGITVSGTVDGIDISSEASLNSTHRTDTTNPHNVTLAQTLAADAGINATTSNISTLVSGGNADALHSHDVSGATVDNALNLNGIAASNYVRTDVSTTINANILVGAGFTIDGRDISVDGSALDSVVSEVQAARNLSVSLDARLDTIDTTISGNATDIGNLDTRLTSAEGTLSTTVNDLNTAEATLASVQSEVEAARSGELTLDARIDSVESAGTTHAADNANPHNVTITQAIAADVGTGITVAELETLSDGSNADGLHTHTTYDNFISGLQSSSVYGAFASADARIENIESTLNGTDTEVTNARNAYGSLDARLDANDTTVSGLNTRVTTNESSISTLDTTVASLPRKEVHTEASALTTWSWVQNLGTDDFQIQLWDDTNNKVPDADATIAYDPATSTVTVTFGVATAGKAVLIG